MSEYADFLVTYKSSYPEGIRSQHLHELQYYNMVQLYFSSELNLFFIGLPNKLNCG